MSTSNSSLYSFILEESDKLKTLYDFINNLKEEAVNQINSVMANSNGGAPISVLVGSIVGSSLNSSISNFYSGANGSGNIVGSMEVTGSDLTAYLGANGTGAIVGSTIFNTNISNFYSGSNGSGILLGSGVNNSATGISNYYSGLNGTGDALGSVVINNNTGNANYYSGLNGAGDALGSLVINNNTGTANYYSGINGTGTIGIYLNQFALPFSLSGGSSEGASFVPYDTNDFFIQVNPTGNEVQTDGYQSSGYTASSSYKIFSLNPDITVSATIYINDVNLFTLEITQ